MLPQRSLRRLALSAVAIGSLALGLGVPLALADSGPGFTLFGGGNRHNQLPFYLDYGGRTNTNDRYRLKIPADKMQVAAAEIAISYPDYYHGEFDTKSIDVSVMNFNYRRVLKKIPIQKVVWDKEDHLLRIFTQEPVPAGSNVEIDLSNVHNPYFGGVYYFNCEVQTPGGVPLLRYLGTWIITIAND